MQIPEPMSLEEVVKDKKGLLLIDKPQSWTSHDVVAKVRKLTQVKRVGHAGTLDPLATGLLIVLVSREYTKLQDQYMKQDKEYLVEAVFGQTTDSYDADGSLTSQLEWQQYAHLTQELIQATMQQFVGTIRQTVPAYSAVKIKGKKLYEKARKGVIKSDELPSREVVVYAFELRDFSKNENQQRITAQFYVKVSSGTYIRSLIHDLGQTLKVGAYVSTLRRISIGELRVEKAVKIDT